MRDPFISSADGQTFPFYSPHVLLWWRPILALDPRANPLPGLCPLSLQQPRPSHKDTSIPTPQVTQRKHSPLARPSASRCGTSKPRPLHAARSLQASGAADFWLISAELSQNIFPGRRGFLVGAVRTSEPGG